MIYFFSPVYFCNVLESSLSFFSFSRGFVSSSGKSSSCLTSNVGSTGCCSAEDSVDVSLLGVTVVLSVNVGVISVELLGVTVVSSVNAGVVSVELLGVTVVLSVNVGVVSVELLGVTTVPSSNS